MLVAQSKVRYTHVPRLPRHSDLCTCAVKANPGCRQPGVNLPQQRDSLAGLGGRPDMPYLVLHGVMKAKYYYLKPPGGQA